MKTYIKTIKQKNRNFNKETNKPNKEKYTKATNMQKCLSKINIYKHENGFRLQPLHS